MTICGSWPFLSKGALASGAGCIIGGYTVKDGVIVEPTVKKQIAAAKQEPRVLARRGRRFPAAGEIAALAEARQLEDIQRVGQLVGRGFAVRIPERRKDGLVAVPYHAWANRVKGPMTLWINEREEVKSSSRADDRLSPATFADPPLHARPGCFWAWLNASITRLSSSSQYWPL